MLELKTGPAPAFVYFGCTMKTSLSCNKKEFLLQEDNISEDLIFLKRNRTNLNPYLTVVPPRGSRTIGDSLGAAAGYWGESTVRQAKDQDSRQLQSVT
jgi:hypothetical protein